MHFFRHLHTVCRHRRQVRRNCFKAGLIWRGLTHDLSKFSPQEFFAGAKYYQGNRSPQAKERELFGYSAAWLHHKGRNKHHFEYWIDFSVRKEEGLVGHKMPLNYVVEMVMDRIAACKVYRGKDYTDRSPLEYYERESRFIVIHPETRALLEKLLKMLAAKGERRTFAYMRRLLRWEALAKEASGR